MSDPASCPNCHAELPPRARFCAQCGTRLAAPAAGERRPVAILFADLAGFTHLSSEIDAEETHRLLGRFFEVVDAIVARCGGTVDKHIGDATMAVFGAPIAHGNDVERAVRAACDIHAAMATLAREFDRPLATHVGVANGEVVAAAVGSSVRADYTVTGDAVNLASRLEELAGAGETVVSDDVRRTLGSRLDVEARGTVAVRGFAQAMAVWRVVALHATAVEHRPLVGRANERERFDGALATAGHDGRGTVLLLRGDPGVGKSRLAESMLAAAAAGGCACHSATILDFGAAQGREATTLLALSLLGLDPTSDESHRRLILDQAIDTGRAPAAHEPFLADLLAIAQSAGSRYEAMDHATRSRGRIDALVGLVTDAARERPVMLLVDDIQWAAPSVIDVLAALRDRTRELPVVMLLATRRDGDPIGETWARDSVERIDLDPLSTDEALELARTYLEANPGVARRCVERAQGNPLFLTQLLQTGAESDVIPGTIRNVVLARLDALPPAEKAALQAASIAGQRFDPALVDHLAGEGAAALDQARSRDLVRDCGDGALMFTHALIRDGAYGSLLHGTRKALHHRAAEWYGPRDLQLRAEHLELADDEGTSQAFLDAARSAASALRQDSALALAQRGAKHAASGPVAYGLAMLAGHMALDIGDAQVATTAFMRAVELADDDQERCAAHLGVASTHRLTTTAAPAFEHLDAAEALAGPQALTRELARIDYLRGSLHFTRGDLDACADAHQRALAHSRRSGDEVCEAQALSGLADVHYANGRLISAHAAFERCVALCDRRGDLRFALMNRNMIGLIDFEFGHLRRGLAALEQTRLAAREIGHRVAEVMADECTGSILACAGHDAEATAPLERSLALALRIGSRRFAAIVLTWLGVVAHRAGDIPTAVERFDESWSLLTEVGVRFGGPALLAARARLPASPAERRGLLAQGEALLRAGSLSHNHFWFREAAIEVALELDDPDEAERHAGELLRYFAAEPTLRSDFVVARGRALAAAARGRADMTALRDLRDRALGLELRAAVPALEAVIESAGPPAPASRAEP